MHIPKRPCRMVELAVMPTNQIRAIFQIYWHLSRAERSKFVRSFTSKLQDAGRRGGGVSLFISLSPSTALGSLEVVCPRVGHSLGICYLCLLGT